MNKAYIIIFVQLFFDLLNWVVFFYVMASMMVGPGNKLYDFLGTLAKPVLDLAKKITPKAGMLDLSPIIAMVGLELLKSILVTFIEKI